MTNLERAINHIKTRADAWAVKEVTEALQSISERLDKALSQVTEVRKLILQAERSGVHLDYGAYKFMNALEKIVGEKQIGEFEQEPCTDAVSREAVRDCFCGFVKIDKDTLPYVEDYLKTVVRRINELPSITQKSGKWQRVSIEKYIQHAMAYYVCSECGGQTIGEPKFCPNCGAKMESEDKE